jgi:hypothetical protein
MVKVKVAGTPALRATFLSEKLIGTLVSVSSEDDELPLPPHPTKITSGDRMNKYLYLQIILPSETI